MKIKIITTEKPGVISLTPNELQELLNEAYAEGYNDRSKELNVYTGSLVTTTTSSNAFDTTDSNFTIKNTPYSVTYAENKNDLGTSISTIGGAITNEI